MISLHVSEQVHLPVNLGLGHFLHFWSLTSSWSYDTRDIIISILQMKKLKPETTQLIIKTWLEEVPDSMRFPCPMSSNVKPWFLFQRLCQIFSCVLSGSLPSPVLMDSVLKDLLTSMSWGAWRVSPAPSLIELRLIVSKRNRPSSVGWDAPVAKYWLESWVTPGSSVCPLVSTRW